MRSVSGGTEERKTALRSLIFMAVFMVILAGFSCLFRPKNNREDYGMGEMKANGILAEPEGSIDVVAVGDSECALAVIPMVLWREQGIASYNCGTTGQYLYEAYSYLKQAFDRQPVKVVLLETNMIYRECTAENWLFSKLERLLPALRYHDRWKSLRAEDLGSVEYTWSDEYKGHMFYSDVQAYDGGDYMFFTDAMREIPRWNQICLREIIALCRENGASLVFVSAPSPVNWSYESHNGVQAFAEVWDIPYVDLNLMEEEIAIDWEKETKDAGDHVNCYGAEKVSVWLSGYLARQYVLTDHRKEAGYTAWEDALRVYEAEWETLRSAGEEN